jgi:uncharacterized protein DUF6282
VKHAGSGLLRGAIDLHTHCFPEIHREFPMVQDDAEMAEHAARAGMAGYVLKSHLWPTMDRAYHLAQRVPRVEVFPSITLNTLVGGCQPGVLEAAVKQGARAAWLPTWSSANDLSRNGFSRLVRAELPGLVPDAGICLLTKSGALTDAARAVVRVACDAGIVLNTGHVSIGETLAVAAEAERIGFTRLVFTHPDSASVGATDEQVVEAARRGATVEWTFHGMLPDAQRITPRRVAEWIDTLGPDRCVLTTDTFGKAGLPMADLFAYYLGLLVETGVDEADLRRMIVQNPAALLG